MMLNTLINHHLFKWLESSADPQDYFRVQNYCVYDAMRLAKSNELLWCWWIFGLALAAELHNVVISRLLGNAGQCYISRVECMLSKKYANFCTYQHSLLPHSALQVYNRLSTFSHNAINPWSWSSLTLYERMKYKRNASMKMRIIY